MRTSGDETHGFRMPSLGELISQRRKALGYTYDQLAEKSDYSLSKQRWQQLGTDTRVNEFPEPRTLELIATVLGVGVDRVILATAVTLGVNVPDNRSAFATMLPPAAEQLDDRQRDAIYAVISAMAPAVSVSEPSASAHPQADAAAVSGSGASAEVHVLKPKDQPDAPVVEGQAAAARTEPGYRKGQAEQGEAGDENQSAGAPAEEDVNQDQDG